MTICSIKKRIKREIRVASIRDALGEDFGIGVDFHGRVHKPMAKVLAKALDSYKLMFLEEVVLPENEEAFSRN